MLKNRMAIEREKGVEYSKYSDEWFLNLYFKYGSVEMALKREALPISVAQFHRLVKNRGIVKTVGRREVSLAELFYFFTQKAVEPAFPLESLYKNRMPASFKTSIPTLHRIYKSIINESPRQHGCALLIKDEKDNLLVGQELSSNWRFGRRSGDFSLPLGFCQADESPYNSVLRVLQQEVATKMAIEGKLSLEEEPKLFCQIDILDLRVKVFSLSCPAELTFSSYKLENHQFLDVESIMALPLRPGIAEIVNQYSSFSEYPARVLRSEINEALLYEP